MFLDVLLDAETEEGEKLSLKSVQEEVDMFVGHDTSSTTLNDYLRVGEIPRSATESAAGNRHCFWRENGRRRHNRPDEGPKVHGYGRQGGVEAVPSRGLCREAVGGRLRRRRDFSPQGHRIHRIHPFRPQASGHMDETGRFPPREVRPGVSRGRGEIQFRVPFSAGPRNCVGQRFAMQEVRVILVNFFRNFWWFPTLERKIWKSRQVSSSK